MISQELEAVMDCRQETVQLATILGSLHHLVQTRRTLVVAA